MYVSNFLLTILSFITPSQKPSIQMLGKIKAVFQLSPLTVLSTHDFPTEAIDRSAMAMNILHTFYGTVEKKRNEC
jgi:hypothetical protein